MAVSRREKNSDANYIGAIGTRSDLTSREPALEDVIEDLRDDMNAMCDLSAANEAKVGITTAQATAITDNTAKRGLSAAQNTLLTMLSDYSFSFTAASGRTPAKLTIRHLNSRTDFEIDA